MAVTFLVNGTNLMALNARRLVMHDIQDRAVVSKLFDELAPRFQARPGGYTRILRIGSRKGDGAETAQIELVGSEYNPNAPKTKAPKPSRGAVRKSTTPRKAGGS